MPIQEIHTRKKQLHIFDEVLKLMKDNKVLIRAEIMGENAGGQKLIHLLANNADGIEFWTDDKSLIWPSDYERTEELKEEAKTVECGVCGRKLKPIRGGTCKSDVFGLMQYWDYMNCPNCGCQVILKKRLEDIAGLLELTQRRY